MGILEFLVGIARHVAWPVTVLIIMYAFFKPISASISRVRTAKLSKDGMHLDLEPLQRVLENRASQEEKEAVLLQSVVEKGRNASGSYTLYSNRTIVARVKVQLKAMTSSRQVVFPIAMVNEVMSVQIVGGMSVKVASLTVSGCNIDFDAAPLDRSIELVVTGL